MNSAVLKRIVVKVLEWVSTPVIYIFVTSGLFRLCIRKIAKEPVIIVTRQTGRLGNKLYLFAKTLAYPDQERKYS